MAMSDDGIGARLRADRCDPQMEAARAEVGLGKLGQLLRIADESDWGISSSAAFDARGPPMGANDLKAQFRVGGRPRIGSVKWDRQVAVVDQVWRIGRRSWISRTRWRTSDASRALVVDSACAVVE